ncbi:MAG: hypothetical protein KIT17_25850 [Rubrivivax sp.]|nr:hypothetical protein [Rubrivivax sp.]
MKKRTRFLASACATLGVMAAAATLALPAQAADKRLALSAFANVSKYSGSEATGSVFLSLGYLFTDSIEGEVRLSQTLGAGEFTLVGAGGKYYFGGVTQAKAWLPYAHASYNQTFGSGLDFNVLRGGVGVDLPLNEAASMSIEGAYVRQELKSGGSTTSSNGSELVVGLKFRF